MKVVMVMFDTLTRKFFGQLFGSHLHGIGADGDSHQCGTVLRRGLIDGDDTCTCGADAGQQALQSARLVPQGGHDGDDLAAVLGIKDAVLILIEGAARKVHGAGGSGNAAE